MARNFAREGVARAVSRLGASSALGIAALCLAPTHAAADCAFTTTADAGAGSFRQCVVDVDPNETVASGMALASTVGLITPVTVDRSLTIGGDVPFTLTSGGIGLDITASSTLNVGNAVRIETSGAQSHGIRARVGYSITIRYAGSINTTGFEAAGIYSFGDGTSIDVGGKITTSGQGTTGVAALGAENVVVFTGSVHATGQSSSGIVLGGASSLGGSSLKMTGQIVVSGLTSPGIIIMRDDNEVDISGSVLANGINSIGLIINGNRNSVSIGGNIFVGSNGLGGIEMGGDENFLEITGSIVSQSPFAGAYVGGDNNRLVLGGSVLGSSRALSFLGAGNVLELQPGYLIDGLVELNSASVVLGGSGTETFDLDLIGAQYTGFSVGEKRGSSTWTLTGTNGAAWSAFDGTLLVNGTAGDMTVNGGVLGGTGTVGNTVINGGALAPGNSVGTLTVAGNLTFAAGGYSVEVEGGASDLTNVTGAAALSGGTADVTYMPSGSVVRQYTILTAAGGLGGTEFAGITDNAPGIISTLSYDANNVYLNVDLAMQGIAGLTGNTIGVASALDSYFDRTGTIPGAFALLDAAGLNQLTGEVSTGGIGAGMDATGQFLNLIGDPDAGTVPGNGSDPLGYAADAGMRADIARWSKGPLSSVTALAALGGEQEDASARASAALAMSSAHGADALDTGFASRWQLWGAAYGGGEKVRGDAAGAGSADLSARTWGLASGVTRSFDGGKIGIALGGAGTSFSLANGLGSGNAASFNAGIHGTGYFGDGYVSAALAYGYHATRTSRTVPGDVLSARFGAQTFGGRLEAGYRVMLGGVALTPYAAAEATAYRLPGYTETSALGGPFALTYGAQTETSVRTELGARTAVDLGSNMKVTGRAAWVWNADNARSVTAAFQALPGTSFTVNGAQPARHAALLEAGIEAAFGSNVTAKLTATGEFSRNVTSFGATAKIGIRW